MQANTATGEPLALSVVVPVHNEQDNIHPLLGEIASALEGQCEYEVVYVDDGSTDATHERLKEAADRFPRLRVLRHRAACGQSTAIRTGVKAAGAPWIVTLDGDGQNDPADILRLVATAGDLSIVRPLMLAGYRRQRRDTRLKRISSRIANAVRARLLRDSTPDTGCGLKLFPRDLFLEFPYFDHMHRFLPALMLRQGGEVRSVEVNHRPRHHGRSHYGVGNRLWVGMIDLLGVMWLRRRARLPDISEE